MHTCLYAGEGESVESAEGVGTQGEIQKAQRTQEIWKEGEIQILYLQVLLSRLVTWQFVLLGSARDPAKEKGREENSSRCSEEV